jgi:adenine-specific DNA-methyltransferase
MARKSASTKTVETLRHTEDKRKNIPTAEHRSVLQKEQEAPRAVTYPRNTDLDPQLVWRGKDEQDWSDLVVHVPPLYIQEKVNPKVLIDDLLRESKERNLAAGRAEQIDLFADFNGIPEGVDRTEFYQHDQNWSNRMILGDSLQVMASLAEREGLRGKVQCIYFDPPYGIKFNSNFQWSTTSRDVKDGNAAHITREPEQVKAFRDTWRDGIHSYLTYLRDRLTVARDLLADSASIFVQIGDENVHRVRAVMDEVFGDENFVGLITFKKTHYQESDYTANIADYLLLYAKKKSEMKFRKTWRPASLLEVDYSKYTKAWNANRDVETIPKEWRVSPDKIPQDWRPFRDDITLTQDGGGEDENKAWQAFGTEFFPGVGRHWRTHHPVGLQRLYFASRVKPAKTRPFYVEGYNDSPSVNTQNIWTEALAGAQNKVYVGSNERARGSSMHPHGYRPRRPRARPDLWLWHYCLRCRAMGPPLDHHRHLPRGACAGPRTHHGRALSVLPAGRLKGGSAQGGRAVRPRVGGETYLRQCPPRLRLRPRGTYHAQVNREQRGNRRHLGKMAAKAGAVARKTKRRARHDLAGMGNPP